MMRPLEGSEVVFDVVRQGRAFAAQVTAALRDPARRERAAVVVLVAYSAVWTLYGCISTWFAPLNTDMTEAAVLARDLDFGTFKHPPLSVWIAGAWFSVFPAQDWAFYLLAISVAAVGLWATWRLAALWIDGDKRVLGLALLTFVPFYNFHALKYNANTILIPLWALATLCFWRSYTTRRPLYAALAGLTAAAAMLGKYWSIFLLAGLAITALIDRRRSLYFKSSAPWITTGVGAIVMAPHIVWLFKYHFLPFAYAADVHAAGTWIAWAGGILKYFIGALAFIAVPIVLWMLACRPSKVALADTVAPADDDRRAAVMMFLLPIVLPTIVALIASYRLTDLWTMPAFALLPVVLLSSPRITAPPERVVTIVGLAIAFPLVVLLVSPIVAIAQGWARPAQPDLRQAAAAVERAWKETTTAPLRIVGGNDELAYGTAFYLKEKPSAFAYFDTYSWGWFLDEARIAREGFAGICAVDDNLCVTRARAWAAANPASRTKEIESAGGSWVKRLPPKKYVIFIIPPRPPAS
jgi:4-amino-4-deoxy-L-arabinose transferase-like glycosyltransferase